MHYIEDYDDFNSFYRSIINIALFLEDQVYIVLSHSLCHLLL